MSPGDLPQVNAVADAVHAGYPEDEAVFAERQRLYPAGCLVLADGQRVFGYSIGHPWRYADPPALNQLLSEIPAQPTTYYIHDIALLPVVRNAGRARDGVESIAAHASAEGFDNLSLVAVNHSTDFWIKQGFAIADESLMTEKLSSYGGSSCFMVRRL